MILCRYLLILTVSIQTESRSVDDQDVPQYYCGKDLSTALSDVCKETGYVSLFPKGKPNSNVSSSGVIAECCYKPCRKSLLKSYCQKDLNVNNTKSSTKKSSKPKQKKKQKRSRRCECRRSKKRAVQRKWRRGKESAASSTTPSSGHTTNYYEEPDVQYVDDWDGPLVSLIN